MRSLCVVLMFIAVALAVPRPETSTYTTKYDNVNIDEILENARLRNNYFKCIMGTQKCTPDGEELKKAIPDAIANDCKACSEKQKVVAEKVLRYLHKNDKDKFNALSKKFDKDNTLQERFKDKLTA